MTRLISWPVARATARERGLRPANLAVMALLVLLGTVRSTAGSPGTEAFSGFSAIWFFALVLLLGGGLLAEEVESGHAQLVLLRPITRAQWVGGRLAGAAFVLCAAGGLAWLVSLVAALTRGAYAEVPARILVLPLALLPALGWLATLAALGALLGGWTNAGLLIAARAGWSLAQVALPLAFPRVNLAPLLETIARHYGPQDLLLDPARPGEAFQLSPALWDVLWLLAAWLLAVRLFNLRELARRRR